MLTIKKLFFLTLLIFSSALFSNECEDFADECGCDSGCCYWDIELRTAYFYPTSKLERTIYDGARFDVEIELSAPLCDSWEFWGNFTYFTKEGKSEGLNLDTRLTLYPLSLGVKYVYQVCGCSPLSLYAGIGVNYTWMHIHDDTSVARSNTNKSRLGGTVKAGAYYQINERFFSDLFIDYLYIPMNLANVYNVGGFRFGIGLGTHF